MGPRDPCTEDKRPIGTKFVRDMPWRLFGQFSNSHDWKAIWKPFGFRRTLAWSFPLDVPEGPKRARVWGGGGGGGGHSCLGYDICQKTLGDFRAYGI